MIPYSTVKYPPTLVIKVKFHMMSSGLNSSRQGSPAPWALFRPGKLIPGDTSSFESLQQVLRLLQDCSENHKICCKFIQSAPDLPTRLLEVCSSGPSAENVRLLETNGQTRLYIALSHCWGKSQMLKTEKSTLAQYIKAISWIALPKTFRDAITFARRIGVRYIGPIRFAYILIDTE